VTRAPPQKGTGIKRLLMIRYRKLGYVALNVSDVERARTWYESMIGLQFNGFGDSGESFRASGTTTT
jgi:catechol-2,3-dioxygenase